jgi:hypothetical protein
MAKKSENLLDCPSPYPRVNWDQLYLQKLSWFCILTVHLLTMKPNNIDSTPGHQHWWKNCTTIWCNTLHVLLCKVIFWFEHALLHYFIIQKLWTRNENFNCSVYNTYNNTAAMHNSSIQHMNALSKSRVCHSHLISKTCIASRALLINRDYNH